MRLPRAVATLSHCNSDTVVSRAEGRGHVVGVHTEDDGVFFSVGSQASKGLQPRVFGRLLFDAMPCSIQLHISISLCTQSN